jgi:hypothetical protein
MLVKSPRFFAQSVKRFPIRRLTTLSARASYGVGDVTVVD